MQITLPLKKLNCNEYGRLHWNKVSLLRDKYGMLWHSNFRLFKQEPGKLKAQIS